MKMRITILEGETVSISTSRLLLRGANVSDVDGLHDCFKDAEVMRYWSTLPHVNRERTVRWVDNMIESKQNGVTDFIIVLKSRAFEECLSETESYKEQVDDGVVIGKAGMWQDNEIGFLIGRKFWGKGLATEAVSGLLDLVFKVGPPTVVGMEQAPGAEQETQAQHREAPIDVVADVDPRNAASLGLLKKLGFKEYATKEKTLQVGDEWVDSVYLSLKRESWMQRRGRLHANQQ